MTDRERVNGHANHATFAVVSTMENDHGLYNLVRELVRDWTLPRMHYMTDQTLGRNVKDALHRLAYEAREGFPMPELEGFKPDANVVAWMLTIEWSDVNEEELGAAARDLLQADP